MFVYSPVTQQENAATVNQPPPLTAVQVPLPGRAYPVLIGHGLASQPAAVQALGQVVAGHACWLVSDSRVAPLYAAGLTRQLAAAGAARVLPSVFPAGEASKTLDVFAGLCRAAVRAGMDRQAVCVALGGGVTGDLAGFCAASYMRGIPLLQAPTTLLAMVDSSVGGKVGIDLPEGKNLVGAFHQPRLVWAELATLATLPEREWACGLAEIAKYAVILDAALFTRLETHTLASFRADAVLQAQVIARCCELKAQVVVADETEQGQRAILNYGHTFGHAVETLGGYQLFNHGEAVAIGMGMAADLAVHLGLADAEFARRQDALLQRLGLPVRLPPGAVRADAVLAAMHSDKKAQGGRLRLVLPRAPGRVDLVTITESAPVLTAIGGRGGGAA